VSPLVKVAIGGAGAYLLYNYAKGAGLLDGGPLVGSGVTANGGQPVPLAKPTGGTIAVVDQSPLSPKPSVGAQGGGLLTAMAARAARDPIWANQMNVHQWCFLYDQVRGRPCPSPPANADGLMTMAEWYGIMGPLGVSGYSG
jgi:hypothetical protein